MVKLAQFNLSGGEVSPAIAARPDIDKYKTALGTCLNFFVRSQGGISNRPGLEFIAEVKDSSKDVFIAQFEFNTSQTYALEFGDQYIRFHTNGGLVLDTSKTVSISGATQADPCVVTTSSAHGLTAGDEVFIANVGGMTQLNIRQFKVKSAPTTTTIELQDMGGTDVDSTGYGAYTSGGSVFVPYEISSPYLEADLFDLKLNQSADVMTITHPGYEQRELIRNGNDDWSLDVIEFRPDQAFPTGVSVTVNTTGSVTLRYKVTAISRDTGEQSLPGTDTSSSTISGVTQADPCVITTSSGHGLVDDDTVEISGIVGMTELNDRRFVVTKVSSTEFSISKFDGEDIDSTGFTAYSSGGDVHPDFIEITNSNSTKDNTVQWTKISGASRYNIYVREEDGVYGYIGTSETGKFLDENINPDFSKGPPEPRDPFRTAGNYPTTSVFYKQRRIFANTDNKTQTLWLTQVGAFSNLSRSRPIEDDDGFDVTIAAAQINEIEHLVPLRALVVLTSGGEWVIEGVDGVITPSTIRIEPQGYYGATPLQPLLTGETAIYMQPGEVVRDINYQFENDAYAGNDLSILSRHLFESNSILDWTFAIAPYSIAWCVRDDGIMLGLTYLKEQNIFAWHRHITRGDFKSVASVRESNDDRVYCVVEREVNGRTVKYIERMHDRKFDSIQDAIFVDSYRSRDSSTDISGFTQADPVVVTANGHGLSDGDVVDIDGIVVTDTSEDRGYRSGTEINANGYIVANSTTNTFELTDSDGNNIDGTGFNKYFKGGKARKAITEIPYLWHLEGETIEGTANGSVVTGLTVSNGTVTLPNAASRVHLGWGYTAEAETLRPAGDTDDGTIQGKSKKGSRLALQLEDSLGLFIGVDRTRMREQKFDLPDTWGQPPELVTGTVRTTLPPDWNTEGTYIVQQTYPLPMTILSLIADYRIGGN